MKKQLAIFVGLLLTTSVFAGIQPPDSKVEVYYFHFTRRCTTCNNVEKVTKNSLDALYPEMVKSGQVLFLSVNLDEKAGEAIGAKYEIEGQALVVISGGKKIDLTDKAFLYANSSPDKLKATIRKAVDSLLK